jgi:hypothetical protein
MPPSATLNGQRIGHRDAITAIHEQNLHHRSAINGLLTNSLRNPLTAHLNAGGNDIKNIRRISTTNSVTIGSDISVNNDIYLGGNLYDLDGNPIQLGGGSEPLFDDHDDTYIVQNSVGTIPHSMTVAQLKQLNSLSNVMARMLDIQAPPTLVPTISGAVLNITTSNAHVKFGTAYPTSISISFNRGTWTNAFQSDGTTPATTLPHNPGNLVVLNTGFGFNGTNSNSNITTTGITNSSPSVVYYSENVSAGNFNVWGNITLNASKVTSSTSTGDVYNNYGNISTPTPTSQTFTHTKTWSVYKPVYVNQVEVTTSLQPGSTAGSNPSLPGTVKVFSNTSDVIIIDHQWGNSVQIPFNPSNVQQYDASLTNNWYNVQFTVTAISSNYNGYGQYYQVDLNIPQRTIPIDVKISI